MNEILTILLKNTFTLTQLKHRVRLLKSYLEKTFFANQGQAEPLTPLDLNWLKSLPDSFYQGFNKDNIYEIFTGLENQINKLPLLTLYLSFEPDDAATEQIGVFAGKTFENHPLLDIKYDPNLIAGGALSWKGIYKDYSLRAKIDERKPELLENFKKFLR